MNDPSEDNPDDYLAGRLQDGLEREIRFQEEMLTHRRRRAHGSWFQGRSKEELEKRVVTHFCYSDFGERLGVRVTEHLDDGRDPPDFRCLDRSGSVVGLELVELANEEELKENAYRLAKAQAGGHEYSIEPPPGVPESIRRMCLERTVMTAYPPHMALEEMRGLLGDKDAKIGRKREAVGAGWDYDQIWVAVWTSNHTVASGGFYRLVETNSFGPLAHVHRAFLVAEPFPDIGEGIVEIPLATADQGMRLKPS